MEGGEGKLSERGGGGASKVFGEGGCVFVCVYMCGGGRWSGGGVEWEDVVLVRGRDALLLSADLKKEK